MARADLRTVESSLPRTAVESGTTIKGDISGPIELVLGGVMTGDVDVSVLRTERGSKLEGAVTAKSVVIRGRVLGPVRARRVILSPEAVVEGDLTCETLEVEPGARLVGRCVFAADPEKSVAIPGEADVKTSEARPSASVYRHGRELEHLELAERLSRIAR